MLFLLSHRRPEVPGTPGPRVWAGRQAQGNAMPSLKDPWMQKLKGLSLWKDYCIRWNVGLDLLQPRDLRNTKGEGETTGVAPISGRLHPPPSLQMTFLPFITTGLHNCLTKPALLGWLWRWETLRRELSPWPKVMQLVKSRAKSQTLLFCGDTGAVRRR